MISFLDLASATAEVRSEVDAAIAGVLNRGWFVLGPEVEAFEHEFAAYVGAEDGVGVGNGLDALEIALRACGIGPGDEVIVPSNTFIATWLAVIRAGALVVPVEPLEPTYNLNPELVERAITSRTRAIVPVHLYGQPSDMRAIGEIAQRRGLRVVSDAAQAHGSMYDRRPIGAYGDAVAWSFYPAKNSGALGDGGAITTSDPDIAYAARLIRNYGSERKYDHRIQGLNSRLDEIQAAVLRVKLRHLDAWNTRRTEVARQYREGLASTPLILPFVDPSAVAVWHLFVVRSPDREALQGHLASLGIQALIHYPTPPHLQPAFAGLVRPGALPISELIHREVLSLPIGPHLTADQMREVTRAVLDFTQ